MAIRKVTIEWDDSQELLSTDYYLLECIGVKPFKKITHFGWILTWRPVNKLGVHFNDWLTLKTEVNKYYWQVERTTEFLTAAGFGEQKSENISHENLIGIKVWARVEKFATKKGEWMNRVKKYLREKPEGVGIEEEF